MREKRRFCVFLIRGFINNANAAREERVGSKNGVQCVVFSWRGLVFWVQRMSLMCLFCRFVFPVLLFRGVQGIFVGSIRLEKNKPLTAVLSVALLVLIGFLIWLAAGPGGPKLFVEDTAGDRLLDDALARSSTGIGSRADGDFGSEGGLVGGVERSRADAAFRKDVAVEERGALEAKVMDERVDPGTFPATRLSASSALRLASDPNYPERRHSAIVEKQPFDVEAWSSDEGYRKGYTAAPVPSRCYDCAQPGEGVTRLAVLGDRYVNITQGETVTFQVQALPGSAVSATSFDGARFSNLATAQSVVADPETGIATFELEATSGVIEECRILIASPVHSGPPAQIYVNVLARP